ncbi:L,D-transpeptidase family protein [Nonomuraea africana]|uniref:Peptidoglycan hydrolase-like protein with peptidoglycan-binding domain n=1 Tax=Nonomuraea africana TaxID=46171 RepID=A0ABR9KH05_9ACTN|nr:L,D-transpeptidase family protein [Nonomuraea africana]MBE1561265.1 peptidoglycan hydrolase-like protein with peptidoglycan-binding domain [Nonomuraea africana]
MSVLGKAMPLAAALVVLWAGPALAELKAGDSGAGVRQMQDRLHELGYFVGARGGTYGPLTVQAVHALQKAAGIERTGVYDRRTRQAARRGTLPRPLRLPGRQVQVDLRRQLLMVTQNGQVRLVVNASTGSYGTPTPRGTFRVTRQIDGIRRAELGSLYRPKYFVGGIAVHGSPSIPPYPASHGCVRVANAAMDHLWRDRRLPVGGRIVVF